jgi:hypothetical protein
VLTRAAKKAELERQNQELHVQQQAVHEQDRVARDRRRRQAAQEKDKIATEKARVAREKRRGREDAAQARGGACRIPDNSADKREFEQEDFYFDIPDVQLLPEQLPVVQPLPWPPSQPSVLRPQPEEQRRPQRERIEMDRFGYEIGDWAVDNPEDMEPPEGFDDPDWDPGMAAITNQFVKLSLE